MRQNHVENGRLPYEFYINDDNGDHWLALSISTNANGTSWTTYSGTINITWSGTLHEVTLNTESESGTGNYFVDDVLLTKQ